MKQWHSLWLSEWPTWVTMMDSIFTFGCSLSYGADHKSTNNNTRPSDDTYTNIIAKQYNLKHFNFAVNGHSNQDIARQVFIGTKFMQENDLAPIFWIGWTKYKHLGLTHPIGKDKCEEWPYVKVHNELIKNSGNEELYEWSKDVYRSVDKMSRFVLSLNTVLQVNSFLRNKGIKVINTFNCTSWKTECTASNYFVRDDSNKRECLLDDWMEKHTENFDTDPHYKLRGLKVGRSGLSYKTFDPYLTQLYKEIKTFSWYEWGEDDLGFQMWCRNNNLGLYPEENQNISTWHPDEKAHHEAAKKIINSNTIGELLK